MERNPGPPKLQTIELSINDLVDVCEATFEARTKANEIGLILRLPVDTLESICAQFHDPGEKLREVLTAWLRKATKPTWQDILKALRSHMVGHSKLASDIEAKHCTTDETGQESGQTMPEVQQPQLTRDVELQTLQQALRDSQELLRMKDQQLEQTIGELQAVIDQLKCQLQQAQQQVKEKQEERERQVHKLTEQVLAMKILGAPPQKTVMQHKDIGNMRWQTESKAPEKMRRGSAASDLNMAYFNGFDSTTVHCYDSDTREWHWLPDAPHTQFILVVVQHMLTMVGGELSPGEATDSLLSLMWQGRDMKWLPSLPAMPTKRYRTAAVCNGHSLIVAGGRDARKRLATVEVLNTDTRQWSIASSLTHPFSGATISICSKRLYMLGGDQTGHGTHSVLSCSVPELLQPCQPQPLAGKLRTAPANQSKVWRRVADVPHLWSSCVTLCGQLVAVGGVDEAHKDTNTITVYNRRTDSWEAYIGDMPTARYLTLVAILNGKMMVVGGKVAGGRRTDVVEIFC